MNTLNDRKHRIRATRPQRERAALAHRIDPTRTARIIVGLAALAMAFLTVIAAALLIGG